MHIVASTYKYLNATDNREMYQPVKMLEHKAATYDVKRSEFYDDEYNGYYISFYIPDGKYWQHMIKTARPDRSSQAVSFWIPAFKVSELFDLPSASIHQK